ncbi:unnamed protein product, partial [Rotaria sordida]
LLNNGSPVGSIKVMESQWGG